MTNLFRAAALSLLMLPGATAFASEGTYRPSAVASPAVGSATDAGVGQSFAFAQGEGGQTAAQPASDAVGTGRGPALASGDFNPGISG